MSAVAEISAIEAALRDTPRGLRVITDIWHSALETGDWRDVNWYLTGAMCSCPEDERNDYMTVSRIAGDHWRNHTRLP